MDSGLLEMDKEEQLRLSAMAALPTETLKNELFRCCGSPGWVDSMLSRFPFCSNDRLLETATTVWWNLPPSEWLTAFTAHPQIGDAAALKTKFAHSSWEGDEQKGANTATADTLQTLADLNKAYLAKNGFIFLICATGKSALEMVHALQLRMLNDSATELQIAAGEQDKITKLRLIKLLQSFDLDKIGVNSSISKL